MERVRNFAGTVDFENFEGSIAQGNILEFFDYFFQPERILSSVILQMINKSFPGSV